MTNWDIRHLQHFRQVFELNSISKAAAQVGISQSAMTKSIKRVEDQLGEPLFQRHTRELQPTSIAHRFYAHSAELIAAHQQFNENIQALLAGDSGEVNIACGPLVQQLIGEKLIESCISHHPNLRLSLTVGDFTRLSYGLLNRDFDFILYDAGDIGSVFMPERFKTNRIFKHKIVFVASPEHPCIVKEANPLDSKWALPSIPSGMAAQIPNRYRQFFSNTGIPQYQMDNQQQCINLALKGLVITAAPYSYVESLIESGELVPIKTGVNTVLDIALYQLRAQQLSSSAKQVLTLIKQVFLDTTNSIQN